MGWLNNFPYDTPREVQVDVINTIESNWSNYDIFVISLSVGGGKSSIAKTILSSIYNACYLVPNNLLLDQVLTEFPDLQSLHRLDSYYCSVWDRPSSVTRAKTGGFCKADKDCPGCRSAAKDIAYAKFRKGPLTINYHTYLAHKIQRDTVIIDEAHLLLPLIQDRMSTLIWQHNYDYPPNMYRPDQILSWINRLPERTKRHKKIQLLYTELTSQTPNLIPVRGQEEFNGKGTVRGEPEMRDCLKLMPVSVEDAPPMFWPSKSQKIILMSSTINHKDIQSLGLLGRRVLYLDCKSPIPSDHRPIYIDPIISVNYQNMESATKILAEYIKTNLIPRYPGDKGVIHCTYGMSKILSKYLTDSRVIYHDNQNKKEMYEYYRQSDKPLILVACGMYEGIDLPGDLGRWQVICKVPWPSLADAAIKYKADQDQEWYQWTCMKTIIQASGRICRGPEDYGETYILDSSIDRLLSSQYSTSLFPGWFREAIYIRE